MYQIMDLKDMELHGAALLFQREYEESRRSGEVPAMTPEMEADVEAGLRQIRENAYGAALRTARRAHEKKSLLFPKAAGHGAELPRAGGCFDPRRLLEGYGGRIYGGR